MLVLLQQSLPLQGPLRQHFHRRLWCALLIFHSAKLLHSPDEQLTSLAGSLAYVALEVLKNTSHGESVDIWATGIPCSLHAQTDSSCLYSDHYLHAPLQLPPFCADNTTTLVNPRIEFHSPYWNPVTDKAKSFIRRLATLDPLHRLIADEALRDP